MTYISKSSLRKDIYKYNRNKAKISIDNYVVIERITEKAEEILDKYSRNIINVRTSDQKIMARYIEMFGFSRRDELLDKLQTESLFNVRNYLEDRKKTWWQRLLKITPKHEGYLSGKKMQKRLKKYLKLNQRLSRGFYHKEKLYRKQMLLENQAVSYAYNFVRNNFPIEDKDKPFLYEYWRTFARTSGETIIQDALKQLNYTPEDVADKPNTNNRFSGLLNSIKQKFNKPNTKKTKKMPRPAPFNKHRLWSRAKIFGLAALMTVSGLFLLKNSQNNSSRNIQKQEIKTLPQKTEISNNTKVLQPVVQSQKLTKEQKVWQNFYNSKSEILANMLKVNAAKLNETLKAQAAKGIYTLPQNTSSEQLVYTHLIYKAYGLPSPIETALNASQKISAQQQANIEQAVKTAGKNGLGVKKQAQKIVAKSGKKLINKSAYNMASNNLKQKYITNLKQVRQLNNR